MGFQTNLGGPAEAEGALLSASYHPLRKKVSYYNQVSELFADGVRSKTGDECRHFVIEDYTRTAFGYTRMYGVNNNYSGSWEEKPLTICGSDIDGDGIDELVCFLGNNLIVYKFMNEGFALVCDEQFPTKTDNEFKLRGCVGDLNVTGLDNIIVTHGLDHTTDGRFDVYEYQSGNMVMIHPADLQHDPGSGYYNLEVANVDIGDVDGDGLPELVFAGEQDSGGNCQIPIADNYATSYTFLDTGTAFGFDWSDHEVIAVEIFRAEPIAANPAEYILVLNHLYKLNSSRELEYQNRRDLTFTEP